MEQFMKARVSAVDRGSYRVRNEQGEVPAELAGKFYFRVDSSVDMPCVGDWVTVQYYNEGTAAIIHDVLPRKTALRRKCAGVNVDFQMIASNIDTALIVQSCHFDFNIQRMHRYLVMVADGGVQPIIVLTKTDLISHDELQYKLEAIKQTGITHRVITLSCVTGTGFDEFQQVLMPGRTYCLLGSSGVGKTTLINRLMGHDTFKTKSVSVTGEGTHATSRRQLITLLNGVIFIDTPGMRELGMLGATDGIDEGFEDILKYSRDCRYANCSHTQESGCAVLLAIRRGELSKGRYSSYMKLKKESEFHDMSYVDKRKKDKAFGRYLKSAKSSMRKK